jgi:hypothetical protein
MTISKLAVTSLFERIVNGTLIVTDVETGKINIYGQKIAKGAHRMANGINGQSAKSASGKVELKVIKESFWVRLFLFADMGFAEAYMLGEVECSDLTGFFEVFLLRSVLSSEFSPLLVIHTQSRSVGERNDIDILNCSNHHRASEKHEYPVQFPSKCLCPL